MTTKPSTSSRDPLIPLRLGRVFAAALACSAAVAVPTALADAPEPDQTVVGTAPADAQQDPADSTTFDPGGDPTVLSDVGADAPDLPGPPLPIDPAPTDPEPAAPAPPAADGPATSTQPVTPPATGGTATSAPAPSSDARPVDAGPAPTPAPAAPPTSVPTPPTSPAEVPVATSAPAAVAERDRPARDRAARRRHRRTARRRARPLTGGVAAVSASAAPLPAAGVQPNATVTPVGAARPSDATSVARFERLLRHHHRIVVVKRGDTLWSIAWKVVGHNAATAAIAREVDLLWAANASRIATGDADLVRVGTRVWVPRR